MFLPRKIQIYPDLMHVCGCDIVWWFLFVIVLGAWRVFGRYKYPKRGVFAAVHFCSLWPKELSWSSCLRFQRAQRPFWFKHPKNNSFPMGDTIEIHTSTLQKVSFDAFSLQKAPCGGSRPSEIQEKKPIPRAPGLFGYRLQLLVLQTGGAYKTPCAARKIRGRIEHG